MQVVFEVGVLHRIIVDFDGVACFTYMAFMYAILASEPTTLVTTGLLGVRPLGDCAELGLGALFHLGISLEDDMLADRLYQIPLL